MIDTSKVIHAPVGGGRYTVTAPIVKEDYGLYLKIEGLELPSTYEVDFSNSEHNGTSVTMIGNADGVLIPSQFIASGKDVFAFLYHVGDNYGRTVFKFRIPNKLRPDRTNEQPTPEQQSVIDQAIAALNDAVEQTAQAVEDADESARSAAESADRADEAKTSAETAQGKSEEAQESAERAKDDAETSERNASESERKAKGYAEAASEKADSIHSMTASAQTLPAGSSASASYDANTGVMTFGIPKGDKGDKGDRGEQGIQGIQGERGLTGAKGDKGDKGDTGEQGIQGIQGEKGEQGIQGEKGEKGDKGDKGDTGEVTTEEFLKAFVTDSASGSIASFVDGADDIPLKSLIVSIDPVQDTSSGDPSPENICPISGWEGMNLTHCGKNLFQTTMQTTTKNGVTFTPNSDGSITCTGTITSGTADATFGYITLPAGSYKANGWSKGSRNSSRLILAGADDGSQVALVHSGLDVGFTLTKPKRIRVYAILGSSTYTSGDVFYPMIRVSTESDATFEAYVGQTIPISWQTEAGTVYGGKLDVLSGVMGVEWVSYVLDGTTRKAKTLGQFATDSYFSNVRGLYYVTLADLENTSPHNTGEYICSHFKWWSYSNRRLIEPDNIYYGSSKKEVFWVSSTYTTLEEFNQYLVDQYNSGTPVTLIYKNGVITEIQLTPYEVKSLLGANNIFADTGDTSAEYRADTKLYIERLTEPDTDMIADDNIVSGQYFMVGNDLYKATANIANGASIIVGTNCTRKSLSEALNEINA